MHRLFAKLQFEITVTAILKASMLSEEGHVKNSKHNIVQIAEIRHIFSVSKLLCKVCQRTNEGMITEIITFFGRNLRLCFKASRVLQCIVALFLASFFINSLFISLGFLDTLPMIFRTIHESFNAQRS